MENECLNSPCQNFGVCIQTRSWNEDGFTCLCTEGYGGYLCDVEIGTQHIWAYLWICEWRIINMFTLVEKVLNFLYFSYWRFLRDATEQWLIIIVVCGKWKWKCFSYTVDENPEIQGCSNTTCLNNATCINSYTSYQQDAPCEYTCICEEGYSGPDCFQPAGKCKMNCFQ